MLPNGYYGTAVELEPSRVRLVVAGMPRSGSTWIWQLAAGLAPDGVIKTHDLPPPGVPVALTIRDPPEALASHMRAVETQPPPWSEATTEPWLRRACEWAAMCLRIRRSSPRVRLLRYERATARPAETVRRIARLLALSPTTERLRQTLEYASAENNRRRAEELEDFARWDPVSLIHGRHLTYNGRSWRDHYDLDATTRIVAALSDFRRCLGYGRDSDVEVRADGPLG